jgi:hypothetical protein
MVCTRHSAVGTKLQETSERRAAGGYAMHCMLDRGYRASGSSKRAAGIKQIGRPGQAGDQRGESCGHGQQKHNNKWPAGSGLPKRTRIVLPILLRVLGQSNRERFDRGDKRGKREKACYARGK